MYTKILVPLDGSPFAESALPPALSLSRRTGADLHILVVDEVLPPVVPEGWTEAAREWHLSYLEEVGSGAQGQTGGKVTTHLRTGHVVEEIVAETREQEVDLVVMASHGRGGLSRAWMGSVADGFIHRSDRPVLLVRPRDEDPPDPGKDWSVSKVLVTLDGTATSEAVLDHASELGRIFGASLFLVRVVPLPKGFKSPYPPHLIEMNRTTLKQARAESTDYLLEHVNHLQARGLTAEMTVVEAGQAAHGILSTADGAHCDLIAMATHGRTGVSRVFLGSTADKVVRGAPTPLLLIHALG
jgi:nucleotide-binding universal stress UspA family protein